MRERILELEAEVRLRKYELLFKDLTVGEFSGVEVVGSG